MSDYTKNYEFGAPAKHIFYVEITPAIRIRRIFRGHSLPYIYTTVYFETLTVNKLDGVGPVDNRASTD